MKIKRLPSGNYNVQKMYDGKRFSVTFNHKPTQKEIENAFYEKRKNSSKGPTDSFKDCALNYIESKSNVLSPSTINSYESIIRNLSDGFLALRLDHIGALDIQREINYYSVGRSPKTVKNASGFISVVMWYFRPDMVIRTKLPQNIKKETYIPTDDEVKKLTQAIKGSRYECVILLCILGLRKSEAIAITSDDLDGNILTINKAKVVNNNGEYVDKTTKTESSTREIYIPDYLAALIRKQGKAYEGFPGNILRYLHRTQDDLGIPRCKLHALRHYYVSMCHALQIPDATIAKIVGHKSVNTTRNIYLHAQKDKMESMEKKAIEFLNL